VVLCCLCGYRHPLAGARPRRVHRRAHGVGISRGRDLDREIRRPLPETGGARVPYRAMFVEVSLSLDNMFVFVLIFSHFAVPLRYHHRVLFYGILGALVVSRYFHRARLCAAPTRVDDYLLEVFSCSPASA